MCPCPRPEWSELRKEKIYLTRNFIMLGCYARYPNELLKQRNMRPLVWGGKYRDIFCLGWGTQYKSHILDVKEAG